MKTHSESRRGFFKKFFAGVAALPLLGGLDARGRSSRAFAQTPPTKPLDENESMAVTLGFKHDASKIDTVKFPKYDGKATCKTCILCTTPGLKVEGSKELYCYCGLFPTGLTAEKGWCNSYAQKV